MFHFNVDSIFICIFVFYPTQINNAHFDINSRKIIFGIHIFHLLQHYSIIIASSKNIENVTDFKFAVPFIVTMVVCLMIMIFTMSFYTIQD